MILAAGLGTRMRPLSDLRAKPAIPVRGRPVISLLLEFLARQGCRDVMINLHHLPETIRAAIAGDHPADIDICFSEEPTPLGTGGGIHRAADFLRKSESCIVLAGDMLLDVPLRALFERHLASGRHATLLLRRDSRDEDFGTVGLDESGNVSRIGKLRLAGAKRADIGAETSRGLFTGVRFFSHDVLDNWPAEAADAVFEDLRDWLVPGIETRGERVGGDFVDSDSSVWEPVGTPEEALRVNLSPPNLPTLGGSAENWGGEVDVVGENNDVIISRKAFVPEDALLERCVVWDDERVPSGFRGHDGIFAGGAFRSCLAATAEKRAQEPTEKIH
jgi:NDP-sugar pyrophosphorylase family protein